MQQPIEPSRAENISFLAGICFFLSAIEYMLPRPVPFMRIGIANLPILVSLSILDAPSTLVLVLLKSVGQGIITGTLFSYVFLFSLAGSLSSGLAMLGLSRLPEKSVSIVGVSLGGALASNLAQILLARVILFGRGAWLIAPLMLIIGIVSSVLLGLFTWHFTARSEWLSTFAASWEGEERPQNPRVLGSGPSGGAFLVDHISAGGLFACGLISAIGYIFSRSLPLKAALCILYIILAYTARKKLHLLPSIIIFVSVVLFQLITPVGKVMYQIGGFKITQGALESGIDKALTLVGMVFLSQFSVRRDLRIPGRFGSLLAKSFLSFERMVSTRFTPDRSDIIGSLDRYLLAAQRGEIFEAYTMQGKTTKAGAVFLTVLIALSWSGIIVPLLF